MWKVVIILSKLLAEFLRRYLAHAHTDPFGSLGEASFCGGKISIIPKKLRQLIRRVTIREILSSPLVSQVRFGSV